MLLDSALGVRGHELSGPSPRADSNNMRIQHISISKLDSYYDRPTLITLQILNSFKGTTSRKDKAKRLNSKAMNCNMGDRKYGSLAVPRTEHTPAV